MFDYDEYLLMENPFPITASINPFDFDPRMNGTIFLKEIFEDAIQDLSERTKRGINVIYISGAQQERGVGKSALMIYQWRECKKLPDSTSLYIRLKDDDKPKDICRKIVEQWHTDETLWSVFQKLFLDYCAEKSNPMLRYEAVKYLFDENPNLCERLPLTLYTQIRDAKTVAKQFSRYLQQNTRIDPKNIEPLVLMYLTEPNSYEDILSKSSTDTVGVYSDLLKLLEISGFKHHYIFLDQFEDLITGSSSKQGIAKISLELKNIVLASSRKASLYLTLHPRSEMLLSGMEAKDLTGIAPLDTIRRVNVMVLDRKGDQAAKLAQAYMDHYRTKVPPYPTYPIEEELVNFISFLEGGNIRSLLQNLYNLIEYGTLKELTEITMEYALENQEEVLGKEVNKKQIDRFQMRK